MHGVIHYVQQEAVQVIMEPELSGSQLSILKVMEEQRTGGGLLEFSRRALQELTGLRDTEVAEATGGLKDRGLLARNEETGRHTLAWLRQAIPPDSWPRPMTQGS